MIQVALSKKVGYWLVKELPPHPYIFSSDPSIALPIFKSACFIGIDLIIEAGVCHDILDFDSDEAETRVHASR